MVAYFFSCKFSQPQVDLAEKSILLTRTGSYKGRLTLSNAEMPSKAFMKIITLTTISCCERKISGERILVTKPLLSIVKHKMTREGDAY